MNDKSSSMNYVLVTGGVISGVGKGIVSSSIGTILRSGGYHVTCIKIDPYLNIDAGTFSPYEHGEVYVLDDGAEVDLDLGNYERYLDIVLKRDNNITTGRVYQRVLQKERAGDYLGKTVQVVPHVTDCIKNWVQNIAQVPTDGSGATPEICIIELGGTISDMESLPFVEAFRQLMNDVGSDHFCCVHVSPIPRLSGELKTKPTQSSVWELRNKGLHADILMSRSTTELPEEIIQKLSRMCHVSQRNIINIPDVPNLYQVPKLMAELKVDQLMLERFKLPPRPAPNPCLLDRWNNMLDKSEHTTFKAHVSVVGKYTRLKDSYVSIIKAIEHAGAELNCEAQITLIDSSHLEKPSTDNSDSLQAWKMLSSSDCVIIPGGFGKRGIPGKKIALQYCRQFGVPVLGICLGFQLMVIEFCQSILGYKNAHSSEIEPECDPQVVIDMPEHNPGEMGGTMRLGLHRTKLALSEIISKRLGTLKAGSKRPAQNLSNADGDSEMPVSRILSINDGQKEFLGRHRHRYEVNPKFIDELEQAGFALIGRDSSGTRMEMGELMLPLRDAVNQANSLFQHDSLDQLVTDDVLKTQLKCAFDRLNSFPSNALHPFYIGTQFHPEYLSRPVHPCRLFLSLIKTGMRPK